MTLRQRVAVAFVAFSIGCLGVGLLIAYLGSTLSHREDLDEMIRERSAALLVRYESDGHEGLVLAVGERAEDLAGKAWLYVYWNKETGTVWAGEEGHVRHQVSPIDEPTSYQLGELTFRGVVVALPEGNRVSVARDVTREAGFERRLLIWSVVAGALVLALSIWLGLRASRSLVGRVEDMSLAVSSLLRGQRSTRIGIRTPGDEFDELGKGFNELLDENDRLISQVREVTNNIAHDLRTPLARIRRQLESVLASPELSAEAEDTIRQSLEETDGLLSTFQALLSIARIESGAFREEMKPVDLAQITRTAVELYEPAAEDAGLRVELDTEPGSFPVGDRHLLSQTLSNLIDNAIKYSPSASAIAVSARRSAKGFVIRVADHGPGIPPKDRERVLERFTRLDSTRGTPGTGLGLSLVAAVAKLHGATLTLSDNEPGLLVEIEFPCS